MSANRTTSRSGVLLRVAVAVTALLGGLLAAMVPAAPAHAEDGDVKVDINGLTSDLRAGRNEDFSLRTENDTDAEITALRRVIIVQLNGLRADQVTITRRSGANIQLVRSTPGPDQVRFDQALGYRLAPERERGDSQTVGLRIRFDDSAPSGEVTVTAYATRAFTDVLGTASDRLTLRSANAAVEPTPTPSPTPPPTTAPATSQGVAQPPVKTVEPKTVAGVTSASGIPPILYILGGILVLLGGGILWLLFRPTKPVALVEGYGAPVAGYDTEQVRPPTLGYPAPRHAAGVNPTTVMPAIVDPSTPPPVDPWANGDPRH